MNSGGTELTNAISSPGVWGPTFSFRVPSAILVVSLCVFAVRPAGAQDEMTNTNEFSNVFATWESLVMSDPSTTDGTYSTADTGMDGELVVVSSSAPSNSIVFTDNYNRSNAALNTNASVSIGANYQLVQRSGDRLAMAGITNNQVQFGQTNTGSVNAQDVGLLYQGLALPDTSVSGNSFTLSGDITTHSAVVGTLLYGLIFNRLDDGSFYAARIDTGADTVVLQFIRSSQGGNISQFLNVTNSTALALSSLYSLSLTSSAPGVFDYTLTGANLDNGGVLSGTATDTVLQLSGGYAGFYISTGNVTPRFDDLSLTVEPAVSGQVFDEINVGEMTLGGSSNSIATIAGVAVVNANGVDLTVGAMSGGTLNVNAAGAVVTNVTGGNIVVSTNVSATLLGGSSSGVISGVGGLTKVGNGTLTLSGANSYSGGITLDLGVLRLDHANAAGSGAITQSGTNSTLQINTTGTVANAMSIYNIQTLQTVTLSGNKTLNNATYTVDPGTTTTESGVLSGGGGITKLGTGTLLVTASNTFTGTVDVQAGVLSLASATGSAAGGTTNVIVATNATLLIAQSDQVNNSAGVTLSGGTIQRASGVTEIFGNLNVSSASFLDFGSGTEGTMSFGTYTGSALLTVNNFFQGNVLTFGTDLSGSISDTNSFQFDNAFNSSWNQGTTTFTITAIPEPSAYFAVVALLGLVLWPAARRIGRAVRPACRRFAAVRCPLFANTRIHNPRGASNY
jgi:autotransporter-associated beta strand protein